MPEFPRPRTGDTRARSSALGLLALVWVLLTLGCLGWAISSPWPPLGEAPTTEQIAEADRRVVVTAVVSVGLAVLGACAAARWRRERMRALFVCGALGCALVSAALWHLAS